MLIFSFKTSHLKHVAVLLGARAIFRQEESIGDRRQRVRIGPLVPEHGRPLVRVPVEVRGVPVHFAVGLGQDLTLLGGDVVRVSEENPIAAAAFQDEEDGVGVEGGLHRSDFERWLLQK